MSRVTNTILSFSIMEDIKDRLDDVNRFESTGHFHDGHAGFEYEQSWDAQPHIGGCKMLEHPTFIGAFNHFDFARFLDHLRQVKWEYADEVQVMVCGQDDDVYTLIDLRDVDDERIEVERRLNR